MSINAIGQELSLSRNPVRKYPYPAVVPELAKRAWKPTRLDNYRDYLAARVSAAHSD